MLLGPLPGPPSPLDVSWASTVRKEPSPTRRKPSRAVERSLRAIDESGLSVVWGSGRLSTGYRIRYFLVGGSDRHATPDRAFSPFGLRIDKVDRGGWVWTLRSVNKVGVSIEADRGMMRRKRRRERNYCEKGGCQGRKPKEVAPCDAVPRTLPRLALAAAAQLRPTQAPSRISACIDPNLLLDLSFNATMYHVINTRPCPC